MLFAGQVRPFGSSGMVGAQSQKADGRKRRHGCPVFGHYGRWRNELRVAGLVQLAAVGSEFRPNVSSRMGDGQHPTHCRHSAPVA
jgi:hypothetical protein